MDRCPHCNREFPPFLDRCPHCGRDVGFPNVRHCQRPEEEAELNRRYNAAMQDARTRGCEDVVNRFENVVALDSKAILNRSAQETTRLATDTSELYANYYQVSEAAIRLPKGSEWDMWRRPAEEAVLPGYKERICFAALSLTSAGLARYGSCSWVCKPEQVAHRATVFEQNCVVFMLKFRFKDAAHVPVGYRALWETRGKLAVAKLAGKINPSTTTGHFPSLLLSPGKTGQQDKFIEVHIYGSLSIFCFEKVCLRKTALPSKAELGALKSKLWKVGVPLEIV